MKKLLVVLMAAVMVLSLAAVAMAEVTVGGELKLIYKTDDKEGTPDEAEWTDKSEAKITATAKVSDSVTGFIAFKAENAKGNVFADEYYINIAQDYGTYKFGYFGHKLTPSLDVIKAFGALKELKANALAVANFNVTDNFVIGLAYALDGDGAKWVDSNDDGTLDTLNGGLGDIKPLYDGAYDVKFGYVTDLFGAEIHVFGNGDCVNDGTTVDPDLESATALDIWYQPIDMVKLYFAYVDAKFYKEEESVDPSKILGVYSDLTDALYVRVEYNLEDYDSDSANYGMKLGYKFANGIIAEFKGEQKFDDTFYKEVSMKVKF